MRDLHTFWQIFEQIVHERHGVRREVELVNLMMQMEQHFDIPMLQDVDWEEQNEETIRLYRTISEARVLIKNSTKIMTPV